MTMHQDIGNIRDGARVLVDSNILLYASSGRSHQCVEFVKRCANGSINGVITTLVLGELCHRWMMEEAVGKGFITGSNPAAKLAKASGIIPQLNDYQRLTTAVIHGNLDLETVERDDFIAALQLQKRYSLMTNDSLFLAVALRLGIQEVASADRDFGNHKGMLVYQPRDLSRRDG